MIWELTQDAADEQSILKVINDTLASETYVEGDVNDDGSFDTADLVLFQRWLLNDPDVELTNLKSADICDDGRLDVFDMCAMRKMLPY
ncbi:MAG TPA: dockerin type I domain-containing protein [Ruminococcus flavefaciens]|nr:dockerin type I domain-containing protein [Ruminococcus flavefaciens]